MFYQLLLLTNLAWITAEIAVKGRTPRVVCKQGPRGDKGKEGWPGPAGFVGPAGKPGIDGLNGNITTTGAFVNVYIDEPLTGIADQVAIPFNQVEAFSGLADFQFDDQTGIISVANEGVYYATFMIAAHAESLTDPTVFGLYVNNALVPGCKYLSFTGQYYVWGQCLFPAGVNNTVSIVNLSGQTVDLWNTDVNGTPFVAVKASFMLYKVSNQLIFQEFTSS